MFLLLHMHLPQLLPLRMELSLSKSVTTNTCDEALPQSVVRETGEEIAFCAARMPSMAPLARERGHTIEVLKRTSRMQKLAATAVAFAAGEAATATPLATMT